MVDNEDGGVPVLFMMSCVTIIFILMSITFVTVRIRNSNQETMDYYASPITQEQIDESWQKFQQRQRKNKPERLDK